MNRLKALAELRQMGLDLSIEEEALLLDAIFDKPVKNARRYSLRKLVTHGYDAVSEMQFEGRALTQGMRQVHGEYDDNPRDWTNYYMNV